LADLTSVEDAIALVLERAEPLPAEPVALHDAVGLVLAEDAVARTDLPPFRSSAMDGFAVVARDAADVPVTLPLAGESAAGHPASGPLSSGSAMRIATGAVVPEGADAVVPKERADLDGDAVTVNAAPQVGAHIREPGRDVRAGAVVLSAGAEIGHAQIAALAAAGIPEVSCSRRPRVAVLATGSELRPPGATLEPGQLYESNGALLAAALTAAGALPRLLDVVADDRDALLAALRETDWDVLVTTGGVSVGEHDLVRGVLAELGVEEIFWRIAMKPGKPVSFGVRDGKLVFGLPGNPVSVLVGFEVLVRPAIRALLGSPDPGPRYESAVLNAPIPRNAERFEFVRALLRDGRLEPVSGQESHMIVRAAQANALVAVEPGEGELAAGEAVKFLRL
jgi:molybdopterin molybdotransferase